MALGALPAPSVFAQDFVTAACPPADDAMTTNDGLKPKILWSADLADMGSAPMGGGNGVAVTTAKLFIAVQDCSLIIMDRSDTNPKDLTVICNCGGSSTALCGHSERGSNARPVVRERGDGLALAVCPSGDRCVIAANYDGTQAWKTFVYDQGPDPVGSVRLSDRKSAQL